MNKSFSIFNIELTNYCPMKCIMCPRTNNMTRDRGYMELDLFEKAIDEISLLPPPPEGEIVWLHHFGESLMHRDFGRCIAYASGHGIRTGLSINPIMLTDEIIEDLVMSELSVLYISLDGHDDESFRRIRGIPDAYELSRERLQKFLKIKIGRGCPITVILSMVDFEMNRASIDTARNRWEATPGIDRFLAKSFTTWDGSAADVSQYASVGSTVDRSRVRCSWPFERMTITWDGDVVPCCFDYDKKYVLGSLRTMTLAEIWTGEPLRRLRDEFITNRVVNRLCANCERLYMPAHLVKL
ncbi:MAG TPA: SPASM domain-containing protein [Spirochaetota bacterium]|nr:SPASM domain-containing protein [Spirochaetota bacterium]HPC42758.1 SPASM domain-containing protein [Spirochaetota bacterium]HQF07607.1 SPASM domain-containing protein [Spirochaetota bacterium]HQH96338.1 SPASM domain-containing protein [Spirochaetota bacterium]